MADERDFQSLLDPDLPPDHDGVVLIGNSTRTVRHSNSILSRSPSLQTRDRLPATLTLTRLPMEPGKPLDTDSITSVDNYESAPLLLSAQEAHVPPSRVADTQLHPSAQSFQSLQPQQTCQPHQPSSSIFNGCNDFEVLKSKLALAYNVSWLVNIFLFVAKAYAFYLSGSRSVLASLADSGVDLVSQIVIFLAEHQSKKCSPAYPVGQARLETIGVLACACVMSVCAFEVIREGADALWSGFVEHQLPFLDTSLVMYVVLGAATALKVLCYLLCAALKNKSDSMVALAEDHLNDIMSNFVAIVTAGVAGTWHHLWWLDPVGGILISVYIVWRWADIAKSQVEKVVGKAAPAEFKQQLFGIINTHHDHMTVDTIRAYHSGARFLVEVEVVMPPQTTLKDVHDVSLDLQHKLEQLDEVERAFVHVDYDFRHEPEHKMERWLMGLQPALLPQSSNGTIEHV